MSIKFKRGLKVDLPTGELGEPLYCTDTNELFVGQGIDNPAKLVQGKLPQIFGKNIMNIEKTKTEGLVDTYTITYSDKSTYDFTITNGAKGEIGSMGPQGEQGIQGPEGPKGDDGLTVSVKLNGSVFNQYNGIITLPSYPSDTNGGTMDLSLYQTKLDTSLTTSAKEIIPSINEINTQLNKTNEQFNTKASKDEVRLKMIKITENDISDTLKSQMTGNTQLSNITKDRSINWSKTNFIESSNVFNQYDLIEGYYINTSNGNITANTNYNCSNFILLEPSTTYYFFGEDIGGHDKACLYNETKEYISKIEYNNFNGNLKTFTTTSDTYYMRISLGATNGYLSKDTWFISKNNLKNKDIEFKPLLKKDVVPVIETEMIEDDFLKKIGVNIEDCTFSESKNLIDKSKLTSGYITPGGNVNSHDTYKVSDYILLEKHTYYTASNLYFISTQGTALYNLDRSFIKILDLTTNKTFKVDENCYIRVTLTSSDANAQLEKGQVATDYTDYQCKIKNEFLEINNSSYIDICLPQKLYIAKGRTIELYYDQIILCQNVNNFNISAICKNSNGNLLGVSYPNKFSIKTDSSTVEGDYTLTINIYSDFNLLISRNITVKVLSDNISSSITSLPFGDSLVNKPWLKETRDLSNKKINFVGTLDYSTNHVATEGERPYLKNEGRSGWQQSYYLSEGAKFTQLIFKVNNITVLPNSKKVYYVPYNNNPTSMQYEFEEAYDVNNNVTTNPADVVYMKFNQFVSSWNKPDGQATGGVMTSVNNSVAGDININYESYTTSESNPFWNPNISAVDFKYYFSKNNILEPDSFTILLGMNNIKDVKSIIDLVNVIQSQMSNKKVFVMIPHYKGDFYYNVTTKKDFFEFAKNVIEGLSENSNAIIVPLYACHDSRHNMGWTEENVNPRNDNYKIKVAQDLVHPQNCGYYQFADILYSAYVCNN